MTDFSAETLYNFETITSNRLSPDGQHIVYALQRVVRSHPEHEFILFFDRKPDPARREITSLTRLETNLQRQHADLIAVHHQHVVLEPSLSVHVWPALADP